MINTLKDINGLVTAYMEWEVLDNNGQFENDGEYIFIQNLWIHKNSNDEKSIAILMKEVIEHKYAHKSKYIYWGVVRDDYGYKLIDEDSRDFKTKRSSRLYKKENIYNRTIDRLKGVTYAQM